MDKQDLITYWRRFFSDLLVGTLKRAALFGFLGLMLGILTTFILKGIFLDTGELMDWLRWTVLLSAFLWYGVFGTFHGLAASLIASADRKLCEMVQGLHGLFDLLSREVLQNIPKFDRTFSKEEMARKFDDMGKKFSQDLRLRGGVAGFLASMIFALILKTLKFLFLDEVAEELSKKPGQKLISSDIESAVRRVGVERILSPINDCFLLIQVLNFVLMIVTFGFPFFLFWVF